MATPNNAERGWLALVFTWQNSFNFLRFVMVAAAFVFSMWAMVFHVLVQAAAEESGAKKEAKISETLVEIGIAVCIMFLPFLMLWRHWFTCNYVHNLSRENARYYRFGIRMLTLLVMALTMLKSTAVEIRMKDELRMIALVMSSMILCEGALLTEDNYGVFELNLTVFVVQFIKTFPKLEQLYLYGIILLVYVGRGGVMYCMKKIREKVGRERNRVEELQESWNLTNQQLRSYHRINVDGELPDFVRMNHIIRAMRRVGHENTAI